MFHKCSNRCDDEAQKLKFMIEYECIWYFKDKNCEAATPPRYIGYTLVNQHPGLGGARHLRRQLLETYGVARKPNEIDVPYIYIYIYVCVCDVVCKNMVWCDVMWCGVFVQFGLV